MSKIKVGVFTFLLVCVRDDEYIADMVLMQYHAFHFLKSVHFGTKKERVIKCHVIRIYFYL